MPAERITVSVSHLSSFIDPNNPGAVHVVGVSHLPEYMRMMFGDEIPHNPDARRLTAQTMAAMSVLSTDDELAAAVGTDEMALYVPLWLRSFSPVVATTKALGKHVDTRLAKVEASPKRGEAVLDNELTYVLGVFDIASFVVASQLDISHPRLRLENLVDQVLANFPPGTELAGAQPAAHFTALQLLARLPIIKSEYRRKIEQLHVQGTKIVGHAEHNMGRLQRLVLPADT